MKIKDQCLEPYYIEVTDNSYNVAYLTKNKKEEDVVNNVGYYSDLDNALRKVALLQITNKNETVTLEEFFGRFKGYLEEFKRKVKV